MKHEIGCISSTNNDWGQSETEDFSRLNTQRYLAGSGKAQCKGIPHCVSVCSTGEPFSHKRQGKALPPEHSMKTSCTAHVNGAALSTGEPTAAEKEQNPSCYCAGSDDLQLWGSFLIGPGSVYLPGLGYLCATFSQCDRPLSRSTTQWPVSTAGFYAWYSIVKGAWDGMRGEPVRPTEQGTPFFSDNWSNTGRYHPFPAFLNSEPKKIPSLKCWITKPEFSWLV